MISLFVQILYFNKIYTFYTIYVLCIIGWIISNYGVGFQWIWSNSPFWHFKAATFFGGMYMVFFLIFTYEFLKIKKNDAIHKRITWILFFFGLAINLVLLIINQSNYQYIHLPLTIFFYLSCLLSLFFTAWLVLRYFLAHRTTISIIFMAMYSFVICTVLTLIIRELFPLPVNVFTQHSIFIGIICEVIVIAFSLGMRINNLIVDRQQFLKERNEKQQELLLAEITFSEKERKRIASDLHDDLGISLSSAQLLNSQKGHQLQVSKAIDKCIENLRTVTQNLHPTLLEQFGLEPTLLELMESTKISVAFSLSFRIDVPRHIELQNQVHVFRIVSEILANIIKHSKAKNVFFAIEMQSENNDSLKIYSKDDGVGFDMNRKSRGLGLKNIESRVEIMKGDLKINSVKNIGSEIMILIPLSSN